MVHKVLRFTTLVFLFFLLVSYLNQVVNWCVILW